jgi:murein DD-endopeptidase MepM/ murein hydrolase activator NlpD
MKLFDLFWRGHKSMRKRYTVMVVPERSSRVRRFRVERTAVYFLLGIVVLFVAAMTFSTIRYFSVEAQLKENVRLRKQNVGLKNQIAQFHERISSIQEVLDRIQRFDAKLRVITELHDPKRHLALGPYESKGGDLLPEESRGVDPMTRLIGEQPERAIEIIGTQLERVAIEVERNESSIRQLENYLRGQKARLSSTPSIWPARGWVTSGFGVRSDPYTGKNTMHTGIDIANQPGIPVIATARGVVTFSGSSGGFGKVVVIDHGYGVRTRYAHLSESQVRVGDHAERGDVLGKIGNSGRSTGPHLHYEVEVNNLSEDPQNFILED